MIAIADRPGDLPVEIAWHDGDRNELRPLFELAEDSAAQLAGYLDLGRVLVARRDGRTIGHLQLVPTADDEVIELKNMAVRDEHHGTGVGRALVDAAVAYAEQAGYRRMVVATATADTGNLRFYQRVGFRMQSVDANAFTPDTGYPNRIEIDGIELRDRVWFARTLGAAEGNDVG